METNESRLIALDMMKQQRAVNEAKLRPHATYLAKPVPVAGLLGPICKHVPRNSLEITMIEYRSRGDLPQFELTVSQQIPAAVSSFAPERMPAKVRFVLLGSVDQCFDAIGSSPVVVIQV